MIKGAIFDLDGTILDSMSIWNSIGEDYLRSLGVEPCEDLAEVFKTFTLEEAAEYYRSHYGVTLSVDEIVDGVNNMVEDFYRNKVELKKGVSAFLERLSRCGIKMCVATVTDRPLVEAALNRLKIGKYFESIFTSSEVGVGKNSPKIYRKCLQFLKTDRAETVVFEDAYHAILTAKNDFFRVAAVYDKFEKNQLQIKAIADFYIADFDNVEF